MTRKTIYEWMNKDLRFKDSFDEVNESLIDMTENTMVRLIRGIPKVEKDENGVLQQTGWIERPDTALICFHLKTKAKSRGYIERQDINHSGEVTLHFDKEDADL